MGRACVCSRVNYCCLTVRDGKGRKDRIVPLAEMLLAHVRAQMERARATFDVDRAAERPGVSLPQALAQVSPCDIVFAAPAVPGATPPVPSQPRPLPARYDRRR